MSKPLKKLIPRFLVLLFICNSVPVVAQELDRFGGALSIVGEKTGRWHMQCIAGRHWFVTPEGHGCYIIGINHIGNELKTVNGEIDF